jgi:hypothetical protein
MSDLKPDRQHRDLHKLNLPVTSRKIGPVFHHLVPSKIKTLLDRESCLVYVCLMNLKCLVICDCEP